MLDSNTICSFEEFEQNALLEDSDRKSFLKFLEQKNKSLSEKQELWKWLQDFNEFFDSKK